MEVKDLNPKRVFEIFDEITKVPRPSKKRQRYVSIFLTLQQSTAWSQKPML